MTKSIFLLFILTLYGVTTQEIKIKPPANGRYLLQDAENRIIQNFIFPVFDEDILNALGKLSGPKLELYISESVSAFRDIDLGDCDPSFCSKEKLPDPPKSTLIRKGESSEFQVSLTKPISLGGGLWQLKSPALYWKNGNGVSWIGLGMSGDSRQNFQSENPIFSMHWNSWEEGSLLFGINPSVKNSSGPSLILNSDENWTLQLTSFSLGKNPPLYFPPTPLSFHFELIKGIYLPLEIIRPVSKFLSTLGDCIITAEAFYCTFANITNLPSFIFSFSDGTSLEIGPDIYVKSRLQLHGITEYRSIIFTVYPDKIILDPRILGNYQVFQSLDSQTHTISLYSNYSLGSTKTLGIETLSTNTDPRDGKETDKIHGSQESKVDSPEAKTETSEPSNNVILVVIGIIVVGCGCLCLLGKKKGWFKKSIPLSPDQKNELVRLKAAKTEDWI